MTSLPLKTILSTQQTILSSIESSNNNVTNAPSSHISVMMASLNSQALDKARTAIAKKFKDPIDLDELNLFTATLQKSMTIAESQLSGAVQVRARSATAANVQIISIDVETKSVKTFSSCDRHHTDFSVNIC
jgi:hypothetical protein